MQYNSDFHSDSRIQKLNVKILIAEIPSLENSIPLLYIIIGPNWTP